MDNQLDNNIEEIEKKPKKSRRKGRKRRILAQCLVCILLVALFVTSAGAGAVAAYYKAATNTIQTDTQTALKDADVVDADLVYDQDVVNILLIGCDKRADETEAGRSDTTMIATIDIKNGKLKLTSLMRDMYIDVPGYGYHKFNAAYSYGGVQLEYETIAENFGIKLDGYVEVDMEAFREVVDLIGGGIFPSDCLCHFQTRREKCCGRLQSDDPISGSCLLSYPTGCDRRIRSYGSSEKDINLCF